MQAQVRYDAGETDLAIKLMQDAVAQAPGELRLRLWLADWMMRNGQAAQALDQLDEIIEQAAAPRIAMQAKADCLIYLGRPKEALKVFQGISPHLSQKDQNSPERLNGLAYYRALAGIELDRAQVDIQRAINDSIKFWWPVEILVPFEEQVYAAAALISRHVDRQAEILPMLSERIELGHDLLDLAERESSETVYQMLLSQFPLDENDEKTVKSAARDVHVIQRTLCVLLSVRALLYQDLDDMQRCNEDRARVIQLGFQPETLVEQLPGNWQSLRLLSVGASFFDTRGMVSLMQGQTDAARRDFDLAILSARLLNRSYTSRLFNSAVEDMRGSFDQKSSQRNEAILLYHRLLLFEKTGDAQSAESDRQQIRGLGFQPGPDLF